MTRANLTGEEMRIEMSGFRASKAKRRLSSGTTLVEMLIALALGAVLLTSLFSMYYAAASSASAEESRGAANREGRMAMGRLAHDMRLVGLIAAEDIDGDSNDIDTDISSEVWSNGLRDNFEYANTYELVMTSDYDADSLTETIRFFLEDGLLKQQIWEWNRDSVEWGPPMTKAIANNVDYLMFMYFDSEGNPIPEIFESGGVTLTPGQRIRVTAVEITLVTRSTDTEQGNSQYVSLPDGAYWYDGHKRLVFRFMIRGRNLNIEA
jgi:type II secretory pathway component PulJ